MNSIIYIPGISEPKEEGILDILSEKKEFVTILFSKWDSVKELERITLIDLHKKLVKIVKEKKKSGKVYLAGRSFGGGVAITLKSNLIDGIILFSPAIKLSDTDDFSENVKFEKIKRFFYNKISTSTVNKKGCPILIFHDPKDEVIPFINSLSMERQCSNVKLVKSNEGHKFVRSHEIINVIIDWLEKNGK